MSSTSSSSLTSSTEAAATSSSAFVAATTVEASVLAAGDPNATAEPVDATDYFYQVEQLTFLWVLFIMIVIGNATVLIALSLSKSRKSRMNFFIKVGQNLK